MITFLRVRPAEVVHELTATTRRREGTTALELDCPTAETVTTVLEGDLLPVAIGPDPAGVAGWVVEPDDARRLATDGVPGWRLTLVDDGRREAVLDALVRARPAYLRTGRGRVAEAASLVTLPGMPPVRVSVFVDDAEQALAAVADGATDLLLRDWDRERIGELRARLGSLVERTVFPVELEVDEARAALPAEVFRVWLAQTDGAGRARPRHRWAPGKDLEPPVPADRLSAAWSDAVWVASRPPEGLAGAGSVRPVLESALEGRPPSRDDVEGLLRAHGDAVDAIAWTADRLRERAVGDEVTYVVNRNINYTNQCYFRCGFCAFSKGPRSLNLRGEPYLMTVDEIVARAAEAWERGATEVTLQGGIHPEFTGDFYVQVVEAIKTALPDMHIHGFTPLEVWQGAETLGTDVRSFLTRLRDAGLGTLPGTAAEILDDDVRLHLCPDKIRTAQWAEVMITAHELGLRSTSTIMFGHIDGPRSWANHLEVLRAIQRRTGGFTEFVPLPFVHMGAPIFLRGRARPGPTWDEVVLIHAVARIAFDGLIPNIQASWVKLGIGGAARLLDAGCNDLGGTLMGEIISRSAGASHGQEMRPEELEAAIRSVGRRPRRRTTVYGSVTHR